MAKFDLGGFDSSDAGVAEGREGWSGALPPTGSYKGKLKVLSISRIGQNAAPENVGKPVFKVGVELVDAGEFTGYLAWGRINLIESSKPFLNQFLMALTDGSDENYQKILKAFNVTKPTVDERKVHVEKIGAWNVNSPNGELPIRVSLKKTPWHNNETNQSGESVQITSFLLPEGVTGPSGNGKATSGPAAPVEEEAVVEVEPEDDEEDVSGSDDESLLA